MRRNFEAERRNFEESCRPPERTRSRQLSRVLAGFARGIGPPPQRGRRSDGPLCSGGLLARTRRGDCRSLVGASPERSAKFRRTSC